MIQFASSIEPTAGPPVHFKLHSNLPLETEPSPSVTLNSPADRPVIKQLHSQSLARLPIETTRNESQLGRTTTTSRRSVHCEPARNNRRDDWRAGSLHWKPSTTLRMLGSIASIESGAVASDEFNAHHSPFPSQSERSAGQPLQPTFNG